jgi:hypothetical protein
MNPDSENKAGPGPNEVREMAVVAASGKVYLFDPQRQAIICAMTPALARIIGRELYIKAGQAESITPAQEQAPDMPDDDQEPPDPEALRLALTEQDQAWLAATLEIGFSSPKRKGA